MNNFRNRIRDLREDMDLRQVDVANATGIDQKTLSNYETGKTNPDSTSLIKLANFFGVSIDYLVGYSSINVKNNKDLSTRLEKIVNEINELRKFLK
ncbi:MAG: helix-turn-helix transcriptional regulator [Oscillospiraceae bacterium]|nr:helix-turn-helix transcriptional regulator [Oscillospiraceae bacterium]